MCFLPTRYIILMITAFVLSLNACGNDDEKEENTLSEPVVRYASEFTAVTIDPETSPPLQLAVHACAGLYNRELGGSIYIQMEEHDEQWLVELDLQPAAVTNSTTFLSECMTKFPTCVKYSYADQQILLPNVLTAAAALGAVPLDVGLATDCSEVAFDATAEFSDKNTPYLATKYVFENFIDQTTGLAMLNPGYAIWDATDPANPELSRDMPPHMVDFVFSEKLFAVFLVNGCIEDNPESEVLYDIVTAGQWPTPIGVYGYNNSWLAGGFIYEAQTRCLPSRNMGAIPTETQNLAFFSTRRPPIEDPSELERNTQEDIEYDPNKTYVAFVIGDGDNVRYIMTTRNVWLSQRLESCEQEGDPCAPITWSISPHLNWMAPDVLQWYYRTTHRTGNDFFTLPPSGHLYAYPSSLNEEDQQRFVTATENDARILGINTTVHWDWFENWSDAEEIFLPKYARTDGVIKGIIPVNVPYMLEAFTWWDYTDFYRVLSGPDGGEVVVFRPREWRGVDDAGTGNEAQFRLSPQNMANEIINYPPGTVTAIYTTSDGGLSLDNSITELASILPDRVQLISADAAAKLALQAHGSTSP